MYFSIIAHQLDRDLTTTSYAACRLDLIDNMQIKMGLLFGVMMSFIDGCAVIIYFEVQLG